MHTPEGASSYLCGYDRPHTWQPGVLAWRQRQAEDTRDGCGTRERTDHSRRFHSQADGKTTQHDRHNYDNISV